VAAAAAVGAAAAAVVAAVVVVAAGCNAPMPVHLQRLATAHSPVVHSSHGHMGRLRHQVAAAPDTLQEGRPAELTCSLEGLLQEAWGQAAAAVGAHPGIQDLHNQCSNQSNNSAVRHMPTALARHGIAMASTTCWSVCRMLQCAIFQGVVAHSAAHCNHLHCINAVRAWMLLMPA